MRVGHLPQVCWVALVVLMSVALVGLAADAMPEHSSDGSSKGAKSGSSLYYSAEELANLGIVNKAGEKIGAIRDIVLSPGDGEVAYVVLGTDGFLRIGESYRAVPLKDLAFVHGAKEGTMDANEAVLKQREGFDASHWPESADVDWKTAKDAAEATSDPATNVNAKARAAVTTIPPTRLWAHRTSRLIGLDVIDENGRTIGSLTDLLVEQDSGKVQYAFIRYWSDRASEGTAAVPARTLQIQLKPRRIMFKGDIRKLSSVTLAESDDLVGDFIASADLRGKVDDAFTGGGFFNRLLAGDSVLPVLALDNTAWNADSEYNRGYDTNSLVTLTGEVTHVGTFYPGTDTAEDGVQLRLKVSDKQTLTIHTGPRSYLTHHKVDLQRGQKITVEGSKVVLNGRDIVMARDIQLDGKTCKLRDADGKPLWIFHDEDQSRTTIKSLAPMKDPGPAPQVDPQKNY